MLFKVAVGYAMFSKQMGTIKWGVSSYCEYISHFKTVFSYVNLKTPRANKNMHNLVRKDMDVMSMRDYPTLHLDTN